MLTAQLIHFPLGWHHSLLTIYSVTLLETINVVIGGGSSEDVLGYGMVIKIRSEYLWDDDLNSNDEPVICGVYKISAGEYCHIIYIPCKLNIYLGQQHYYQGEQTSNILWWPKQSVWEGCGPNIGYW